MKEKTPKEVIPIKVDRDVTHYKRISTPKQ
jgi:hypothetical protein